jgi:hypothetical protein
VLDDSDPDELEHATVTGRESRIGGQLSWDTDGDGVCDEAPVLGFAGAPLTLTDFRGIVQETISDADGEFLFANQ